MFFDLFKKVCDERGKSPSSVVLAAGMSKSNITEWKRGSYPTVDTVIRLAAQLGVSPRDLIPVESEKKGV